MRESLTVLAFLLVLLLSGALGIPYFVDWSNYRSSFETQLSQMLGRQVRLSGPIDLRLLPTPWIDLKNLRLASFDDQGDISAEHLHLRLAFTPLLSGQLRFTEIMIDQLDAHLVVNAQGELSAFKLEGMAAGMQFEHLVLHGAKVQLSAAAHQPTLAIQGLDLEGELLSASGPFKAQGHFSPLSGEPQAARSENARQIGFKLASGHWDRQQMALKLSLDAGSDLPRLDLNGQLRREALMEPENGQAIVFQGTMASGGAWPVPGGLPWSLEGQVRANFTALDLSKLELRLGSIASPIVLNGQAKWPFDRAFKTQIDLSAHQLDFDRLNGAGGAEWTSVNDVRMLVDELLQGDGGFWRRLSAPWGEAGLDLHIATPVIHWQDSQITDVDLALAVQSGASAHIDLRASAPGQSSLSLSGDIASGQAAGYRGRFNWQSNDLPGLEAALEKILPQLAERLRSLPFKHVEWSSDANVSPALITFYPLTTQFDHTRFDGGFFYTAPAAASDKGRLLATLSTPLLRLDQLPDIAGLLAQSDRLDLPEMILNVEAQNVRLSDDKMETVDLGHMQAKISADAHGLRLDPLDLSQGGNMRLQMHGQWQKGLGHVEAHLDSQSGAKAAGVPSMLLAWLMPEASKQLSLLDPLKLAVSLEGNSVQTEQGAVAKLRAIDWQGSVAQTRLEGHWSRKPQAKGDVISLVFLAQNTDTAPLLEQLGLSVRPLLTADPASLRVQLEGPWEGPLSLQAKAEFAGVQTAIKGHLGYFSHQAPLDGQIDVFTSNIAPLLQIFGKASPPQSYVLPVEMHMAIETGPNGMALKDMRGKLGSNRFSGRLQWANALTGDLRFDHLAVRDLITLMLGPSAAIPDAGSWPTQALGAGLTNAPPSQLSMTIDKFDLFWGLSGAARWDLHLSPNVFSFENMKMQFANTVIGGHFNLRRDAVLAILNAHLEMKNLALVLPSLSGALSGTFELSSSGKDLAGLIGQMSGAGALQLSDATIPAGDNTALRRVIALVDQKKLSIDETALHEAIAIDLDKVKGRWDQIDFDTNMTFGTLRLKSNSPALQIGLDLRSNQLNQHQMLSLDPLPKNWTGPPAEVGVNFRGPVANPVRSIDDTAFFNGLAAREIMREGARAQTIEEDMRERAAFVRRLRGLRKLQQDEKNLQNSMRAAPAGGASQSTPEVVH